MQILGISSDSTFALKTYADSLRIQFPLLSDRHLVATRGYKVLAPDNVRPLRAFFLVDEKGVLRRQWLLGLPGDDLVFDSEPILKAIQGLKGKG